MASLEEIVPLHTTSLVVTDHCSFIFSFLQPSIAVDMVIPPMQNLLPTLDMPLFTVWLGRCAVLLFTHMHSIIHFPICRLGAVDGVLGGLIAYGRLLNTSYCSSTINYVP